MLSYSLEPLSPSFQTRMSDSASELSTCPFCGSVIPAGAIIVEYEVAGEQQSFETRSQYPAT
jgi:hypothetical protein